MRPGISFVLSCFLLAAVVTTGGLTVAACGGSAHPKPVAWPGEAASARFMTEVRLRKLHLVRPDLIPYPIETEVYC